MVISPRESNAFSRALRISCSLASSGIQPSSFSCPQPGTTSSASGLSGFGCSADSWGACPRPCPSRASFLERFSRGGNLDQRTRRSRLIQQPQSAVIGISRERSLHGGQKTAERSEGIIHRRRFIPAVHHAIRAMRIARLRPIVGPLGFANQLVESFCVAILKQITRLLPAENVIGRHPPGRAGIMPLAQQEFEKPRRTIQTPIGLAIRKNRAEQPTRARQPQKMLLVGRLLVRISG